MKNPFFLMKNKKLYFIVVKKTMALWFLQHRVLDFNYICLNQLFDMKIQITTLSLLVSATTMFAQIPSITSTNQIPAIGDTINYTDANPFGFDPAGSGGVIDVDWDYQTLVTSGTVDFWYEDPSLTTEAANFPTATVAMANSIQAGYEYFETTANTISRLGYTGSMSIYYAQAWNRYEFPIDPGVSWNTTLYSGTLTGLGAGEDSATVTNGTYIANPDAYGTVVLPPSVFGGQPEVFEDVVRIHVTEDFQIIAWLFGTPVVTINISDDYYFWIDQETQEPVLIYGVTTDDAGGAPQTVLRYQAIAGTGSSVTINENTIESTSISPNPSKGIFTIQSDLLNKKTTIQVINLIGEVVHTEQPTGSSATHSMNLNFLPKGVYILSLKSNGENNTHKIVIE